MPARNRYCSRCDEDFLLAPEVLRCPACGVAWADANMQTQDLDVDRGVAPPAEARERNLTDELLGTTVDIYAIQRLLGRGGMAWVFLAAHENLHRPCALKILCPEGYERNQQLLSMFVAEARTAASLVHPHVVTVHNIGQAAGRHFIELEYVPGQSLQRMAEQQRLSVLRITELVGQVTGALAEAHRRKLVHRDFKPANVMVRHDGVAKLADFGLAKQITADDREPLAGTPYFMAPELFQGQPASAASDMYAVGVTLFYLLSGEFPFHDERWTELARLHAEAPVPELRRLAPEVPDELVATVERCLSKSPRRRPTDAGELQATLENVYRILRDLPSLAAEAFQGMDIQWQTAAGRIEAVVSLTSGRRQRVFVEETLCDVHTVPLVRIYSLCAPVRDSYLRQALQLNAQIPHAALAIEAVAGEQYFVMMYNYPRATCDAEEIRRSVADVARWADEVERVLTGQDRH